MRIKEQFKVREMAGENVVIMQGKHGSDLTRIISLNDSALYLWQKVNGHNFDCDHIAQLLVERYDIDNETALNDAKRWIAKLEECGLIEN